jgi:hypothetical protein
MPLRRLHALAAVLFVVTIVIQVILAGLAIGQLGGSGNYGPHVDFGYTWVGLAALALVVTAVIARMPRLDVGIAFGLLGLYILQTLLPETRSSLPFIAALHPLNAMILFVLAVWYARRAWRLAFAPAAANN